LLRRALPDYNGSGSRLSGLVVLGLLTPAFNIAGVTLVAALFNSTLQTDFAAMSIPKLDPLVDTHICFPIIIPVLASLPFPWRMNVVAIHPLNLFS